MNDDETLEMPVLDGVKPDPDLVDTQPIPRVTRPAVREPVQYRSVVVLPKGAPLSWVMDPILTMPRPRADRRPLYDQVYGSRPRVVRKPPRRTHGEDRALVGLGVAALAVGAGLYGMVTQGWGTMDRPQQIASSAPVRPSPDLVEPLPPEAFRKPSREPQEPVAERASVVVLAAPQDVPKKRPVRSVVVVPSPTPTPSPSSSPPVVPEEEPTAEPEPVPSTTAPSPSPSPSQTVSPTPKPPFDLFPTPWRPAG